MTGDRLEAFRAHAPRLRALAYRMLGSAADADDVVQDAFVRWERASVEEIRAPRAFLTTVVTHLCIDAQRSARSRREVAAGPWLPEPQSDPPEGEALSVAVLVLLESLSPVERAIYLLHAAFDLEYAEIAPIVGKSEANCRQIARRATAALAAHEARYAASREERHRLAAAFADATRTGRLDELAALLAEDIELWADGGPAGRTRFGRTRVVDRPLVGSREVTRFIAAAMAGAPPGFDRRVAAINGEPGIVGFVGDRVVSAIAFLVEGGRIRAIYLVADPEKLSRIALSRGPGAVSSTGDEARIHPTHDP